MGNTSHDIADGSANAQGHDHTMPSRRERLRVLMQLRFERKALFAGLTAMGALAMLLGTALWDESRSPEIVRLGKGVASVDARPVAAYEPRPAPAAAAATVEPVPTPSPSESAIGAGHASYYGSELAGNRTASGEAFDPERLTAAHRTLPLGSKVRVTNARTGSSVVVRINDRGPFHGNRVIDLSTAAARTIGLIASGTGRVNLALLIGE